MKPCAHHWLCEEPGGPTSKAVCAKCGAEDEFANSPIPYANPFGATSKNRAFTLGQWPQRKKAAKS